MSIRLRGIATVIARKNADAMLAESIRAHYGIDLPTGPRRASAGEVAFAGVGPGAWLATCENGENDFAVSLTERIGLQACIPDHTDAYVTFHLGGENAREVLASLVPIDVHPRAFGIGDVAVTHAAHITATLWRLEDEANGTPAFEILVYRSYEGSFRHALSEACASTRQTPGL